MRFSSGLWSVSFASVLVVSSACIGPDYPDGFDDTTLPVGPGDAGLPQPGANPSQVPQLDAGTGGTTVVGGTEGGGSTGGGAGSAGGAGDSGAASVRDAGSVAPVRDASAPSADASTPRDASVPVEAGTGSEGGTVNPSGSVSSCTITATTDASTAPRYRGEYGCAVWIANESKKVVKAFLVATLISSRSGVPTYRSQASGESRRLRASLRWRSSL